MRSVDDWLIKDCMIGDQISIMRCTTGRILLVNHTALNRWREGGSGHVQLDGGPYCFAMGDDDDDVAEKSKKADENEAEKGASTDKESPA
jgi:hypothetical protein